MRHLIASAAVLLACAGTALAADVKANSTIESVVVFPDGAEITRVTNVSLAAGDQTVVLKDLPASLISDSVRIQGEAAGKVEIGSVDTRQFYRSQEESAASGDERKKLQDELQALTDKQSALDATIAGAKVQKQLIDNLSKLPLRPAAPAAGAAAEPDWGQLFTLIGARLAEADKTIADAETSKRDVAKKIAELQRQINQQPLPEDLRTEVKVHVSAAMPQDAVLRVRYQVAGAAWYPIYDARLETGDSANAPKLTLVRRAIVSQQTGEPWDDVRLSLSTTRPGAGTSAPELVPLSVDFAQAVALDETSGAVGGALARKSSVMRDAAKPVGTLAAQQQAENAPVAALEPLPAAPPAQVEQQHAATINTTYQAVYVIPDHQSIASGVGDKRVQIDTKALEPSLYVRAVPKFSETAFLYAKYKLDADSLLLPGGVSLFRDGVFVGRGEIPQLIGGEEQQLGFGADDKLRIKFANLGRTAGETGIISTSKTDTQSFKMTAKNLHSRPIELRILDQVPVSLNDQIKVDLLPDTAPPTKRDVDDKKGLLAWDLKLAAGEQKELTFGYQVSWPNGHTVEYEEHPGVWSGAQAK